MERSLGNRPELLAPAGDFDMLKYAVAGGADAVYLGLTDFSARSKAKNFTTDELRSAAEYCHKRGVRVYLALNTLMKDAELDKAVTAARSAYESGVDAVLVQDFALLFRIKKELPCFSVHASTQMGVHNAEGARFAKRLGIDRVVLSREVISPDIKKITDIIETEMFVHGAMCVSFSGNCYFSSIVSGLSGNRGKCLQLCRKRYTLSGGGKRKTGYMLSPKDISMYGALEKLHFIGVSSLKIEGRLRSKEYAYTVSDVYSRALDGHPAAEDEVRLKSVFNRGDYSAAYLENDKADIIYDLQQNNIGAYVGRVTSARPLKISGYKIFEGDGFKFMRHGRETVGAAIAGDSAHLTKSGRIAAEAAARLSKDCTTRAEISQSRAVNVITVDRLIKNPYALPEKCVIIKADEDTDAKVLERADIIIYSPSDYDIKKSAAFKKRAGRQVLLDMPVIARGRDADVLRELVDADIFDGYMANNIYALELCREKPMILGAGMNSLSRASEPRIASIESAVYDAGDIVYAFGRYALMSLTHSPLRQLGLDESCPHVLTLKDDAGNNFQLRKKKLYYSYFELLNAKVTNLLPKLDRIKNKRIMLDSAGIGVEDMRAAALALYDTPFDAQNHTYGRLGKGVK